MLGPGQLGRQRLQLGGAAGGNGRPLRHPLFQRFIECLELLLGFVSPAWRSGSPASAAGRQPAPC